MSYTHTQFSGDHPDRFPPPQMWLVWMRDDKWGTQHVPNRHFDDTKPADYGKNPEFIYATGILKRSATGKVRHKTSLEHAKRMVAGWCRTKYFWVGGVPEYEPFEYRGETQQRFTGYKGGHLVEHESPVFSSDWKIFEFVDGEWVLRYEGQRGDVRKDHPLWERVGRRQKIQAASPRDEQEAYARKVVEASIRRMAS